MVELEYWEYFRKILILIFVLWLLRTLNYLHFIIHFFSTINAFFKSEAAPPEEIILFHEKKIIKYESDSMSLPCPIFSSYLLTNVASFLTALNLDSNPNENPIGF